MPTLERLFRLVGGGGLVVGLLLVGYGVVAGLDLIAMLAGVFAAFVGATLVASGVLLERYGDPDGPLA